MSTMIPSANDIPLLLIELCRWISFGSKNMIGLFDYSFSALTLLVG